MDNMKNRNKIDPARRPPLWGILGGMGPLASMEFLNDIYSLALERGNPMEQAMPRVVLFSDPYIPDRTAAILDHQKMLPGQFEEVKHRLQDLLEKMQSVEVDHIVIACITAHFFLHHLELFDALRAKIISLIDVIYQQLLVDDSKYLLLSTSGAREAGIFQSGGRPWQELFPERVVLLSKRDQEMIHTRYLYDMKCTGKPGNVRLLLDLKEQYGVDGFIAGCTEVHLQTKDLISSGVTVIDPLSILAERIVASNHNDAMVRSFPGKALGKSTRAFSGL
jgi:aspartate racemase